MKKYKFSIAHKDEELLGLIGKMDKKLLAVWAIKCVMRVLPYFEDLYPNDKRPRKALETLEKWIQTGAFSMQVIRKASLDAHIAAREVGEDIPARSTARAAGQAVATAHVAAHAYGAAVYAQQAVFRATNSKEGVINERNWQYKKLLLPFLKEGKLELKRSDLQYPILDKP